MQRTSLFFEFTRQLYFIWVYLCPLCECYIIIIRNLTHYNESKQTLLGIAWCQNCGKEYFSKNLSKWTSGNEIIDEIIKKAQFEAKYNTKYVEWIPYDEFDKIKQIGKGG